MSDITEYDFGFGLVSAHRLQVENQRLRAENEQLGEENEQLGEAIFENQIDHEEYRRNVDALQAEVDYLQAQNERLRRERDTALVDVERLRQALRTLPFKGGFSGD